MLVKVFLEFEVDFIFFVGVFYGVYGVFCVGVDLKVVLEGDGNCVVMFGVGEEWDLLVDDGFMGLLCMLLFKFVIVVIVGYVVVGGMEFVLWCDLRVMEEDVVFGIFCWCWGVFFVDGGMICLLCLIG